SEYEDDGANDGVDDAEQQRRHNQGTGAVESDTGKELIGDPQAEGGDEQSDEEASHGAEDNRCARPATNRAVMPGRACTPSLESSRIAPLSESRPAQTVELMTGARLGRSTRGDHEQHAAHHGAH